MNIEGQNLSSSYRKIRTRMLRYPCRLVADQKERQVPTVSLWLCFGFPRKYRGKEKTYTLRKLGDDLFWCDTLDEMLKVAVVCVPALEDVQLGVGLGGFFAVLLSSGLSTRQKVEKLQAWGFVMTEEMQKENEEMLDTWEGFGAALTKEGVRKGKREGRSIGMREATISHVRNLATKQKLSFDEAMEILGVSKESRDDIRGELTQDQEELSKDERTSLKEDSIDTWISIGPELLMRGLQIGIQKGKSIGMQEASTLLVRNLATKQNISFDEAMEVLDIPKASRAGIHKKIAQNRKKHPGEENIFLKKDDMDMYIGVGIGPWLFMRGVQIGIKKGRLVGKQDVSALHVRNLAEKQHISFEEAMEILKIPKASRTAIHKKIAQYQKRHDTDVSLL